MDRFDRLQCEFKVIAEYFVGSAPVQRVFKEAITLDHYKSLLRQLYHHVRENPQVMAMATAYFRGQQREIIKDFCKHAISEMGHDKLAMQDLVALGEPVETLPYENPLPSTLGLVSYAYYQVQNLNPVGLLGYIFFLEFLSTQYIGGYVGKLEKIGVPRNAMGFLMEHSKVDVGHNKLMEKYVQQLVVSEEHHDSVVYAMKVTGKLYADMIQGAFDQVDNPKDWGLSSVEREFALKYA